MVKVLSILDRHEGGSAELRRRGYDFTALLEANENGEIAPCNVYFQCRSEPLPLFQCHSWQRHSWQRLFLCHSEPLPLLQRHSERI